MKERITSHQQLFHSRRPSGRGPLELSSDLDHPNTPRPEGRRLLKSRAGRTIWAVLGFLILFTILVVMVSKWILLPGLEKVPHETHAERQQQAAYALLLMSVMLTILIVGLLLTFRIGRFFFPRPTDPRSRTKVVDAWAEAGKRMEEDSKERE